MQQMATVRLSFWQALSDLGGFHDGIYVLVKAFIAPIAASLFQSELVKGIRVDPYAEDEGKKEIKKRETIDNNATWQENQSMQKDKSEEQSMINVVKRLEPARVSFFPGVMNCICHSARKHKGYWKIQRLVDFKTDQLDIRSIISNAVGVRDFFTAFLSEPQLALLAQQRSRVPSRTAKRNIQVDPFGFESSNEFNPEEFKKAIEGFIPKDSFEQRLVQGVLGRFSEPTQLHYRDEYPFRDSQASIIRGTKEIALTENTALPRQLLNQTQGDANQSKQRKALKPSRNNPKKQKQQNQRLPPSAFDLDDLYDEVEEIDQTKISEAMKGQMSPKMRQKSSLSQVMRNSEKEATQVNRK